MAGAGYTLFVAGQVLTAAQVNTYLEQQTVMVFSTAAARDSALSAVKSEGMMAFLLDVNNMTVYTGAAWSTIGPVHGAWASAGALAIVQGVSVTATTARGSYTRVGRLIIADGILSATSSGTAANLVTLNLPLAISSTNANTILGWGHIFDSSANTYYQGYWVPSTSTTAKLQLVSSTAIGKFAGTDVFTAAIASGDTVAYQWMYEAAADG